MVEPRRAGQEPPSSSVDPLAESVDIATAPTIDATPAPTASTVPPQPKRTGARGPIVVATVLVVLLVAAGAGWLLSRDYAPSPEPRPVRQNVAVPSSPADGGGNAVEASPPPPRTEIDLTKTHQARTEASSVLQPKTENARYGADRAFDGRRASAWGAKREHAAGQWLEVTFDREVAITSVDVLTGHCRNDRVFKGNRRVKRASISIDDWQTEQDFTDDRAWQTVRLSSQVEGTSLKLTILEFYEGDAWHDLHVSEIRVWGHPTTP